MAYNDHNIAELDAAKRAYETYAKREDIPDHLYNRCWDVFYRGWELSAQFNSLNEVAKVESKYIIQHFVVSLSAVLALVFLLACIHYFYH